MKDWQIIKALEYCQQKDGCAKCPYRADTGVCFKSLHKDAYYYIQRLKNASGKQRTNTHGEARK